MSYLLVAIIVFILSFIYALIVGYGKYKPKRWLTPFRSIFIGTFLSACFIYAPIFSDKFSTSSKFLNIIKQALFSIQYAIRMFVVDSDFNIILDATKEEQSGAKDLYLILWLTLTVVAPLLTFAFILSFFKSFFAYARLVLSFNSRLVIFSELNEKSISLANNLYEEYLLKEFRDRKKPRFVFCDVFESNEEDVYELIEQAREIKAICFKKDVLSVNFKFHRHSKEISFHIIGDNESENIKQSLGIIKNFNNVENSNLYVFAATQGSEMILSSTQKGKIRVRRINETRSLIYNIIENMVEENSNSNIFENAVTLTNGLKQISAVIVGLGNHGTEMLRALSWFTQMTGYKLKITAFDKETLAESKFSALCPGLMDEKINGKYIEGDALYNIKIYSNTDVLTQKFIDLLNEINDATYVFVSLGSDELNIKTAANLRMIFERMGISPIIQSVVYNTDKKNALKNVKNYKSQSYNIEFVGDLKTLYSPNVIINSNAEKEALEAHKKYIELTEEYINAKNEEEKDLILQQGEEVFYKYEYNYNSSVTKVIHNKVKQYFGLKDVEDEYKNIEHIRWNAYMRSEGYVFSEKRNDLAKTHYDIVSTNRLPENEKKKDV